MPGNPAYLAGLDRNQANYAPLTPLTFLERAAYVYPDRLVGDARRRSAMTWRGDLRALPPAGLGAGEAWDRAATIPSR